MHPRPKPGREEGSMVEQLLASIGVRRHQDPFAHLAGDGEDASGWLQARIGACLGKGACPVCDALRSSLADFRFWLPSNLRDADYFLSLRSSGGFCPGHLDAVMTYLRDFPYSQVRLFTLLRMLIEEGRFASGRSCRLCRTLEESRKAHEQALLDRFAVEKDAAARAVSCLCRRHAGTFGRAIPTGESVYLGEKAVFPKLERRRKAALMQALEEIAAGFHVMETSALKERLGVCESLLREAMAPDAHGSPRRARGNR